ncbi:MAG: hypothetical protein HWN81_00190 [Candidatus Lokiarchaeota archaeon]|nr:hypothetical protein [Candidatus Lokiarchaeota archaeon]
MAKTKRTKVTKELLDKEFVEVKEQDRCLATALYETTRSHPFMGAILQCLNIMYTHALPTAGVSFNADAKRWDLFINPKFFCHHLNEAMDKNKKSIGDKARKAILLHELYHITNKHPMRVPFIKLSPNKRRLMNVAADMAINQFIQHLPKGCSQCPPKEALQMGVQCANPNCCGYTIHVEDYYDEDENGKKTPWPEGKTMEHYYDLLLRKIEEGEDGEGECQSCNGTGEASCGSCGGTGKDDQGKPCKDCSGTGGSGKVCPDCKGTGKAKGMMDTLDSHDWDGSGDERDMIEATEDLVKRAMVKQRMSYDDLPGGMKDLLEELKARRAELDYRGEILAAIKKSASGHERKSTWTRKSRRFGTKAPGTKVGDLPKLNFYLDTSGSISIEELNEFLEIVDNFLRAGSRKCRLNLFHTSNYYSEEYKLGMRIDRSMIESGGTCLESSMRDIAKRKADLNVFVTDGCYCDVDITGWLTPGTQFPQCLYIISREGDAEHPLKRFGKTIKIPASTNVKE